MINRVTLQRRWGGVETEKEGKEKEKRGRDKRTNFLTGEPMK